MTEQVAERAEYERGYVKGYEDGLLAPQSEWMKARRKELAQAWERGHFYCAAEQGDERCDNPYLSTPPGQEATR